MDYVFHLGILLLETGVLLILYCNLTGWEGKNSYKANFSCLKVEWNQTIFFGLEWRNEKGVKSFRLI